MVSRQAILDAIGALAGVDGALMSKEGLFEDVVVLARSYPDEREFRLAVGATVAAMRLVLSGRVNATPLSWDLSGWESFHFQHRRENGQRAGMRLVCRRTDTGIEVKAFGHRHEPSDFYGRVRSGGAERR